MTDNNTDHAARVTERLKAAGWLRDDSAERLDWPEFEYTNSEARLEFLYPPDHDWARIGIITENQEGYLKVQFGEHLEVLLGALVAVQNTLGTDSWENFIEDLLAAPLRVYAISGEDGDDLVELTPLGSDST